ncbi:tripartite tricarboxylate transporter substrate binding protein [Variovorax sp. HJSM1_2]|uniref:tripartite tricarboxylate transporter substrate binding protein n=1 Tax=Variovorax sp. HJSM1_2 TaxID=3366263 RepID=UPI003BBCC0FC
MPISLHAARRRALALAALASTLTLTFGVGSALAADPYPSRLVTLLVPYPAGGLSDAIARALNVPLGRALGQQVIVDNLGGVSGALAAQKVLNAPADGYLVFLGSPNELILAPLANLAVKLKAEDFRMISQVTVNPLMLVARPGLPVQSTDELVAYAKAQGSKGLSYGSVGVGSMYHLLTESMAQQTNIQVTHVPYKGMAPLVQDMGGNNVDFAILPYATSFRGLQDQGRLKMVGWLGGTRSKLDPAIPAMGEGQNLKSFNHATWAGLMVSKGTPEEIVLRLNKALTEVLQDPEVRKQLSAIGSEVARPQSLDEADKLLKEDSVKFRAMAKSINLQPQ